MKKLLTVFIILSLLLCGCTWTNVNDVAEFNLATLSGITFFTDVSSEITQTISKSQFRKDIKCKHNSKNITVETPIFTGIPVNAVDTYKKTFLFVDGTVILDVSTQKGTMYFKVDKDGKISATDTDYQNITIGRDNSKYLPEYRDDFEGQIVGNDIMIIQEGKEGNYIQYLHTTSGQRISNGYDSIGYFFDGLAIITKDKRVGLLDENGNEVLAPSIAFDTITYPPTTREFSPEFMSENAFILPLDGEIAVINIKR